MKKGHYCVSVTTITPSPHSYLLPAMELQCFYRPPQVSCCLLFVRGHLFPTEKAGLVDCEIYYFVSTFKVSIARRRYNFNHKIRTGQITMQQSQSIMVICKISILIKAGHLNSGPPSCSITCFVIG